MKDLFKLVGSLLKLAALLVAGAVTAVLWIARAMLSAAVGLCSIPASLMGGERQGSGAVFRSRMGAATAKSSRMPPAPSLAEYHAAGVNPDICTLCQKQMPERQREWKYLALDGRPAILCPRCWGKNVTNATPAQEAAFMRRISTRVWNTPRL